MQGSKFDLVMAKRFFKDKQQQVVELHNGLHAEMSKAAEVATRLSLVPKLVDNPFTKDAIALGRSQLAAAKDASWVTQGLHVIDVNTRGGAADGSQKVMDWVSAHRPSSWQDSELASFWRSMGDQTIIEATMSCPDMASPSEATKGKQIVKDEDKTPSQAQVKQEKPLEPTAASASTAVKVPQKRRRRG